MEHSQLPGPLLGPEGRPLDVVRGHHSRGLETEVRIAVLARELDSRDIQLKYELRYLRAKCFFPTFTMHVQGKQTLSYRVVQSIWEMSRYLFPLILDYFVLS